MPEPMCSAFPEATSIRQKAVGPRANNFEPSPDQVRDGLFSAISERRFRPVPSLLTVQTSCANGCRAAAANVLLSVPPAPGVGVGARTGAFKSTAAKVIVVPSGE